MKLTKRQLRRIIREAILLEIDSGVSIVEKRLFEKDDELVYELQEISRYGPRYHGSEHVGVGYLEESPFLSEEQVALVKSINPDPMGSYSNYWEYSVVYEVASDEARAAGKTDIYRIYNTTAVRDWGTSVKMPASGRNVEFWEESEVIDWINDMSHAVLEFAVTHSMADKSKYGYADPGPEFTKRTK